MALTPTRHICSGGSPGLSCGSSQTERPDSLGTPDRFTPLADRSAFTLPWSRFDDYEEVVFRVLGLKRQVLSFRPEKESVSGLRGPSLKSKKWSFPDYFSKVVSAPGLSAHPAASVVSYQPKGDQLVVALENKIYFYDLIKSSLTGSVGVGTKVSLVTYSPNSVGMLVGNSEAVQMYLPRVQRWSNPVVIGKAFSADWADAHEAILGMEGGCVVGVDLRSPCGVRVGWMPEKVPVSGICISSRRLVAVGNGKVLRIFDWRNFGEPLFQFGYSVSKAIAWHPEDASKLAYADLSSKGGLFHFDVRTACESFSMQTGAPVHSSYWLDSDHLVTVHPHEEQARINVWKFCQHATSWSETDLQMSAKRLFRYSLGDCGVSLQTLQRQLPGAVEIIVGSPKNESLSLLPFRRPYSERSREEEPDPSPCR